MAVWRVLRKVKGGQHLVTRQGAGFMLCWQVVSHHVCDDVPFLQQCQDGR